MNVEEKKLLRNKILAIRNLISHEEMEHAAQQILSSLVKLPPFVQAKNIFCYFSYNSEVPTDKIIEYCLKNNKNVYIPACVRETKEMAITQYTRETKLTYASYGIREAVLEDLKLGDRNELDLVILPGAVFDVHGHRIGYGAGYYDKFFALASKKIYKAAIAYSFQVLEEIPTSEHDEPMDCIITEKSILFCSKSND